MKVTYYGHSCFSVETVGKTLLFDPFITPNPLASSVEATLLHPDYIFLSHGHFDHVADAEEIARRSGATIIANYEVAEWFGAKGLDKRIPLNSGGSCLIDIGRVTFTTAIHSSSLPDGSYGGQPGGFRVETEEGAFYYSGDTALTRDIELIALAGQLKFAALCIGDHLTMGARDAATAAQWLGCREVLGVHYDTFPPITIDQDKARETFLEKGVILHLPALGETIDF